MENKNEGLGISINAQVEKAHQGLQDIVKQLNLTGKSIVKTQQLVKDGSLTKYIGTIKNGLETITTQIDGTGKELKRTVTVAKGSQKAFSQLFDVGKLYLYWNLTKRIRTTIKGWVTSAIDYQETVNKFNVSMGSSVQQATRFQHKLSETFGTAKTEMMNYQATFKNILSGLGDLSTETTEQISETLVKMGLDYSSLFNVSQSGAMEKLQSALTGSIVPIRKDSGYDVSNLTIVAKAQELGVDKTSAQLTQMEKRILKIIVLMEQMKRTGAFQDLARTIESPSNQLKVLQNQLQELGVWLGNVFTGTLGAVLPYINGFVMALKEIIKLFAIFVGYEETATGLDDAFKVVDDNVGGIADGLGSANKSAKELKRTLMGFDVLNVIQTPTESSGGGGAGSGVGSIDPKILGALSEYDSLMGKVRMKAIDIRNAILEWLGFTLELDEAGDLIGIHLNDGYTRIEKILDLLQTIGTVLLGYKLSKSVLSLFNLMTGNKLSSAQIKMKATGVALMLGGVTLIYKGVKRALEDKNLTAFELLEILSGGAMTFVGGAMTFGKGVSMKTIATLGLAIAGITLMYKGIKETIESGDLTGERLLQILSGGAMTVASGAMLLKSKFGKSISIKQGLGLTLALTGISLLYNNMKKALSGNLTLGSFLKATGDSLLIGIGTALTTGSMKLGLVAGIISEVINIGITLKALFSKESYEEVEEEVEETVTHLDIMAERITKVKEEYESAIDGINKSAESKKLEIEYTKRLSKQLENYVDKNGKVKKGYEERVDYILGEFNDALDTEYKLNGNTIEQNGKVAESYQDLQSEIDKTIEQRRREIEQQAYLEIYKEKFKEQIALEEEYNQTVQNNKKALEDLKEQFGDNKLGMIWYAGAVKNAEEQEALFREELQKNQKQLDSLADKAFPKYEDKLIKMSGTTKAGTKLIEDAFANVQKNVSKSVSSVPVKVGFKLDHTSLKNSLANLRNEIAKFANIPRWGSFICRGTISNISSTK